MYDGALYLCQPVLLRWGLGQSLFHQGPVGIELSLSLCIVSPICPQRCLLQPYHRASFSATMQRVSVVPSQRRLECTYRTTRRIPREI